MNKTIVNLEPELSGNCSWTKFAGEELKILAPLQKAAIKSMIMIQHIYWYDSRLCSIFTIQHIMIQHFYMIQDYVAYSCSSHNCKDLISYPLKLTHHSIEIHSPSLSTWLKFLTLTLTLWWLEVGWEDDSWNRKLVKTTVFAPNLRLVGYSRWQSLI